MGISLFFVSLSQPSNARVVVSALLLGLGISNAEWLALH
jgi:diguanylate cyclase